MGWFLIPQVGHGRHSCQKDYDQRACATQGYIERHGGGRVRSHDGVLVRKHGGPSWFLIGDWGRMRGGEREIGTAVGYFVAQDFL